MLSLLGQLELRKIIETISLSLSLSCPGENDVLLFVGTNTEVPGRKWTKKVEELNRVPVNKRKVIFFAMKGTVVVLCARGVRACVRACVRMCVKLCSGSLKSFTVLRKRISEVHTPQTITL